MALDVSAAPAHVNGHMAPSPAEDEELYTQLLRLRDAVLAGKHAHFKLPPSAVEQLKATLIVPAALDASEQALANSTANLSAYTANHQQPTSPHTVNGLPGLHGLNSHGIKSTVRGLDPIFLEKSDSLVRAEGQLKRQRIERDLQVQVDQRRHTAQGKDAGVEGPSRMDIDAILKEAWDRVPPVSGLKPAEKAGDDTSFDENDYYSSQVQSDWSSDASSSKGSDRGLGAFTADYERLGNAPQGSTSFAESSYSAQKRALPGSPSTTRNHPHFYTEDPDDDYEPAGAMEDDEYTPPDAAAFDSYQDGTSRMDLQQNTPPDDDNSDYEPGEITQDSGVPTPRYQAPHAAQASPQVPVIHNRLTHLAAPQPNRVSPLATAKGPSIELELVNGRPEVVQKPQPQHRSVPMPSRASTASPSGNVMGSSGKKRRNKKRKRDQEPNLRNKKRRDREAPAQSPVSPAQREPFIKDEPVSPPPFFANVPEAPAYGQSQYRPAPIDLSSPRHAPPIQYAPEPPQSALRYEYAPAPSPAVVRVASPGAYRPVQRDTQDLRRLATMHHTQRPTSPPQRHYSPVAPYRAASMAHGEQRPVQLQSAPVMNETPRYQEVPAQENVQYVRAERGQSPSRVSEYADPYGSRAQSPAPMPPPPPPPRRIIVDQFGNRYYAAEPAPPSAAISRASVAPVDRRPQPEPMYERGPSRMSYAPAPPAPQYDPAESAMAPPPPPHARRQEQPVEYIDANGYRVREYSTRPTEPIRYAEPSTSPTYQQVPRYDQMPPPPAPPSSAREPTSPVYQQAPRAYSVRPEEQKQPASSYMRQASVAPVQYVRQDMPPPPPVRAVSVMPGTEYGMPAQQQQPMYSYAPPAAVKYVDQYGREVYPQQVRQVSEFRYQ